MIEILIASIIAAVVAGGTMMAFVTAARMTRLQSNPVLAEASGFAMQTVERFRNQVTAQPVPTWFATKAGPVWYSDPLPVPGAGTNTESLLWKPPTSRTYRVTAEDCDGIGGVGDCYAVTFKVCWNTAC